jgi:23S rRNA (pseudouridine1915-N3)-methyltransferase
MMKIRIIAIGQKMPVWVTAGYEEYAKRINDDCQLELLELPMQKRQKNNNNIEQLKDKEAKTILDAIKSNEKLVVLDVLGKPISTHQLSEYLKEWKMDGQNIAVVIGGPDGLASSVLNKADQKISLSKLTLPHPLVRVLLAEQLYRAWSINHGHPYHR